MSDSVGNIDIDVPADIKIDEIPVSHTITLKDGDRSPLKVRVNAEPHQWKLLQSNQDPIKLVEAFCHPGDWPALNAWFSARFSFGDALASKVLDAMVNKPTGHPTSESGGSSEN